MKVSVIYSLEGTNMKLSGYKLAMEEFGVL